MKQFIGNLWTAITTSISRVGTYAKKHKIISGIAVLIIAGLGYWAYSAIAGANKPVEYVLAAATQGPFQVTVTGSGQVSANDTLNLTPQASGEITNIYVKPGQKVTAGTIVAELDMTTAAQQVTSAQQNLESAQIAYQQELTTSNASVSNDQTSVQTTQASVGSALATTDSNLPGVMSGLDTMLHNLSTLPNYTAEENIDAYANYINTPTSQEDRATVEQDYTAANTAYQNIQSEYAAADPSTLTIAQTEQLAQDSVNALQTIDVALKDTYTYYNYINDQVNIGKMTVPPQLATELSDLTNDENSVNSDISSVSNANTALINAEQSLAKDTQSLGSNATPLNVQSAELDVQKAQESLAEAETNEANYIVRAPFDGTIASVPANQYDQASSGTTIATLVTSGEYADLSLNETDAAKVQDGQAVTMTFDALPNVTMNGTVAEVDGVGTVSEGVVSYDVKIGFDQQNAQIKPAMTVEATIVTASSTDAIQVPSAAVKTMGNISYVEVATLKNASSTLASFNKAGTGARRARTGSSTPSYGSFAGRTSTTTASTTFGFSSGTVATAAARQLTLTADQVTIQNVPVVVGLTNDTSSQILSGLKPGQFVVTATQTASANTTKTAAASATSLLGGNRSFGGGGGFSGGGAVRVGGGGGAAVTAGRGG